MKTAQRRPGSAVGAGALGAGDRGLAAPLVAQDCQLLHGITVQAQHLGQQAAVQLLAHRVAPGRLGASEDRVQSVPLCNGSTLWEQGLVVFRSCRE